MMTRRHIAIIAPPTPGHLNPLQVLGGELVRLGHRVTIVHRHEAAPLVRTSGIGFAALPDGDRGGQTLAVYQARLADPTGPVGLTRMIRATAAITRQVLDRAPSVLAAIGADAVIADSAEGAGPRIAYALGLPHVVSVTGLPLLGEPDVPPPFLGWRYRPDAIGRFRNRGGYQVSGLLMRPIARELDHMDDVSVPRLYVAQCPRVLDYPRRHLPPQFRYGAPWRVTSDTPVDLPRDERPLVFCSLGTLQGQRASLFATMAAACAQVGARAVIGHGGGLSAQDIAALPGDPLVRAFWPQDAVLRQCVAAILHGGFNTVLDALAAGVPIVTLPIAFEQPGTAARLAWIGAGLSLSPARVTPGRLAAALTTVTRDPRYRAAALRIAREMRGDDGAPSAAAAISAALA